MKSLTFIAILGFVLIEGFDAPAQQENSKSIEIEGTVVARERLSGHVYSNDPIPMGLIVRVDKRIKGTIGSKHILVTYQWRIRDDGDPYSGDETSKWKMRLKADRGCANTSEAVQFIQSYIDGKFTTIEPRYRRSNAANKEDIDLEALPCYKLERKNVSYISTEKVTTSEGRKSSKRIYVLNEDMWIDIPESPVALNFSDRFGAQFVNVSYVDVNSYTMACVKTSQQGYQISQSFPEVKEPLRPNIALMSPPRSDEILSLVKTCYELKSALAVVKVDMADGRIWEAK